MSDTIILNKNGEPFASEAAAQAERRKRELDPATHAIVKYGGGWAIERPSVPVEPTPVGAPAEPQPTPAPVKAGGIGDRFFRVTFQPRQSETEPVQVELWLNGHAMVFQRSVEVVVPLSYLEVADQTTRPVYVVRPGQGRKLVSRVKSYPYAKGEEVGIEEWRAYRAANSAKAKAANESTAA